MRLGSTFVDAAHRLFTVAVEKNFVQGRRTTHVVAACLYIACRQEKSQHMLIDFSDTLQVNVYTLGTTFLKFRRLLGLKLEIIDPALYIYRFAAHLGLDKKANAVAMTALRLVARMKRDWIVAGRRPAGICAAALLIAARAHGFSRDHQDVTRILRVCGLTVSTRVKEFERTPSAMLTLETFGQVDLEQEADPPVFTRNKILEARATAIQNGNVELLTSGALDNPAEGKKAAHWRGTYKRKNPNREEHSLLYSALEKELAGTAASTSAVVKSPPESQKDNGDEDERDNDDDSCKKPAVTETSSKSMVLYTGQDVVSTLPEDMKKIYPRTKYGKALVLPDYYTEEERQISHVPTVSKISLQDFKQDLPESVDLEIESMFRTEEEERQKEVIFNKLNKDYIEQQKRKESDRATAEANSLAMDKDDILQAHGHARYNTKRNDDGTPLTTEEQLLAAMANRKVSRKINYDAMSSIFDEDGSFAMDGGSAGSEKDFDMM
jgi:transcription factor IIIB subunit 2